MPLLESIIIVCRPLEEGALLEALEEKGLVDEVMKSLNLSRESESMVEQPLSHGGLVEGGGVAEESKEEGVASPQHLHHNLSYPNGML